MMESIKLRQRVGEDGILHLELPVGLADHELDVTIVYQPVTAANSESHTLEDLYGICADDPIVLDGQGISEALDDEMAGVFD